MHHVRYHDRRGGFTLVELLVVVGIIAILVAILLPAMNKARESAEQLRCLSTIRQAGMLALGYVNDNRGAFPVVYQSAPDPVSKFDNWVWLVLGQPGDASGLQLDRHGGDYAVFRCPSFVSGLSNPRIERTYMLNTSQWHNKPEVHLHGLSGQKITSVYRPSEKAMLFDIWLDIPGYAIPLFWPESVDWKAYYDEAFSTVPYLVKAPHKLNGKRATSVLYVDGHAEMVAYIDQDAAGIVYTLPEDMMYPGKP